MNLKEKIVSAVFDVVNTRFEGVDISGVTIEKPGHLDQGDYSVPVMAWSKIIKRDPYFIASEIKDGLKENKEFSDNFSKVECAQPGYINFYISKDNIQKQISEIIKGGAVKFNDIGKNEKMNVEFISVNPTGELHIGHARGAFYGDVLCNVLSASGYDVVREYYVNNAKHSTQIKSLGKTAKGEGEEYKTEYLDKKISENKSEIKSMDDGEAGYFLSGIIQKDISEFLDKKANIHFDVWKEEEDFYGEDAGDMDKTMNVLKDAGLVYESEGAVWVATSKIGAEKDDVIIRSNGDNTYFFADIAYHLNKVSRGFYNLINIWGADHYGHINRLCSVLNKVVAKSEFNIKIITSQLVRIKGGEKLSKRKGNIITMEEMVDLIGVDVARYFYLVKSLNTQMEIDLDVASDKSNNNPLFYIQYTNARICSIIKKTEEMGVKVDDCDISEMDDGEMELARKLVKSLDVVERVSQDYQVHNLSSFVFDLSHQFNQFYRDYRVIDGDNVNKDRLALAKATGIIICSVLDIMGISHPDSM